MTNPYNDRFAKRAKGQRYDDNVLRLLSDFPSESQLIKEGFKVERTGTFEGPSGYGGVETYIALIVTTSDGVEIPAYRRNGECFVVCQNTSYKMKRLQK